jgi:hypothetical protein
LNSKNAPELRVNDQYKEMLESYSNNKKDKKQKFVTYNVWFPLLVLCFDRHDVFGVLLHLLGERFPHRRWYEVRRRFLVGVIFLPRLQSHFFKKGLKETSQCSLEKKGIKELKIKGLCK